MATSYLDSAGLALVWEKIKGMFVAQEAGKGLSSNDYTSTEKTKLAGIAEGAQVNVLEGIQVNGTTVTPTNKIANVPAMTGASSSAAGTVGVVPAPAVGDQEKFLRGDGSWQMISGEVNQNAFSNVKVGNNTIQADTKTDTLEIAAGTNITLTPDTTNDKVTITHSTSGVTAASKGDTTAQTPTWGGTFKVTSGTVDAQGHLTAFADHNVTIPDATASTTASGLMSSDDKSKLNGIAAGAEVNQNAYSTVKVGDSSIAAGGKTDTFEISAGTNITLTPDTSNKKVTIAAAEYTNLKLGQGYGTSSTAAATVAKTVTLSNYDLTTGGIVAVKFSSGCTSLRSLNINSKGAKYVIYGSTTTTSSTQVALSIPANHIAYFMYNGTQYVYLGTDNDYIAAMTQSDATTGTSTTTMSITPKILSDTIDAKIAAASVGGATFQGTVSAQTTITNSNYKQGWYWVVATAGTYVGQVCEAGDMIFAIADKGSSYSASDFSVVQTNLDITSITAEDINSICV